MNEQELIKKIAQPIIEMILKLEDERSEIQSAECPQIRLITDDFPEGFSDPQGSYTGLLLKKVEDYIQSELEKWYAPTILH